MTHVERHAVKSADGTVVVAWRSGHGPALVLVHGIGCDASRWALVRRRLDKHYTLYTLDRRGRGESGDAHDYAVAREIEDVVALAESVGEEVFLCGHSFGGLVALEAARAPCVRKLLLYEPYVPASPASVPGAATRRYMALADAGERDAIVTHFLLEIVRMSPDEVAHLKSLPSWATRVGAAHTIVREMAAVDQHDIARERLGALRIPIRFLVGGESPGFLRNATARLHAALPTSDVVELRGQGHNAIDVAPALFVSEVTAFFGAE